MNGQEFQTKHGHAPGGCCAMGLCGSEAAADVRQLQASAKPTEHQSTRDWDNLRLGRRTSTGFAARRNRGRNTGQKIHSIVIEEVIGVIDEAKELAKPFNSIGKVFLKDRKPVKFSAWPQCGCTSGQNAAVESKGAKVTCEKCGVTS